MSAAGRAPRILLTLASVLSALMLLRLVWDLASRDVPFGILALVFYLLFLAVQALLLRALHRREEAPPLPLGRRLALGLAVPVALVGSVSDCMGLSFEGCSPVCGFLTRVVAPVVAVLAVSHALVGGGLVRLAALSVPFVLLVPNCLCRNPVNGFWIDLLGRSPACFLSAFTVALVAASALVTRRHSGLALLLVWGTNAVLIAFAVGHHLYHWPW